MKKITLFYLFLQTLALCMLLSILIGTPDNGVLSNFERFGYAVAAFGISLMLGLLVRQRFSNQIDVSHQILLTIGFYPIMLFLVHTTVTSSPELIAEQAKPAALQTGVKVLSDKNLKKADFKQQIPALMARFPIPDEQIRLLYLQSIKGLSQLIQQKDIWSNVFTEEQLKQARTGLHYKNNKAFDYTDRLTASYIYSMASGALLPLSSRTFAQVGLLARVEKEQLKFAHSEMNQTLMIGLKLVTSHSAYNEAMSNKRSEDENRQNFVRTKRMLKQLEQEIKSRHGFQDFTMLSPNPGQTFDDAVKRSLTAHVLAESGIPTENMPESIMFPVRTEGRPYQADAEFTKLIRWLAPYLVDHKGQLIISIADLGNPKRVKLYEDYLSGELPGSYRDNFVHFYNRTALELGSSATAWQSPVAMEFYGHFLRIGKILPWLLLLSFILLTANFVRVARQGFKTAMLASVTVVSAFFIFHSPLLPWIITPVLWVSI